MLVFIIYINNLDLIQKDIYILTIFIFKNGVLGGLVTAGLENQRARPGEGPGCE